MIRDIIRDAWSDNPGQVIASIVAAPLVVAGAIVAMWVLVPAIENVLEWAGIPS